MPRFPRWALSLLVPLVASLGACTEDLDTGETCPLLCPGQSVEIRDTILTDVIVFDTNLVGFPFQGNEDPLLLATMGDSLDVRTVVRFDTLPRLYSRVNVDTVEAITAVDSVFVTVFLSATDVPVPSEWSIEAYDVYDPAVDDTLPNALVPLFAPGRRIGTFVGDTAFSDSLRIRIPIDSAYFRQMLQTPGQRFRVGLRVVSSQPVMFWMVTSGALTGGPNVAFKVVSGDATDPPPKLEFPSSRTPERPPALANDLRDFQIVVAAPDRQAPGRITVGGLPGSRAYLRFNLPAWLTDSVALLRAELQLTQESIGGLASTDTLRLDAHVVLAGPAVTSLMRAATILSASNVFLPSQILLPNGAQTLRLNANTLVRQWSSLNPTRGEPTALVLRSALEGSTPGALRFHSSTSTDVALRPRLRVSYTPRIGYGRP